MNEHLPARMNLHSLSRAQARYESGMEHVRRGRHGSAARSFTRAIRLDRENAEYRYLRGLMHFHLEWYDRAISDFRDAIARAPAHVKAHTCLGNTYAMVAEYDLAVECYEEAIRVDPGYAEARASLEAIVHFWAAAAERPETWAHKRNSRQH